MHQLVPAVLLRIAGLDALDADPEPQPPHGELGQAEECTATGEGSSPAHAYWKDYKARLPKPPVQSSGSQVTWRVRPELWTWNAVLRGVSGVSPRYYTNRDHKR